MRGFSFPLEITKKTEVAYGTVRQTHNKPLRLKRIERMGQGRLTRYSKIT